MSTDQSASAGKPLSQDELVAKIIDQLHAGSKLDAYHSFSAIMAGVARIRDGAVAECSLPLGAQQHALLQRGVQGAHDLVTSQVGPQMQRQVNMMFGGVRFLLRFWKDRLPGAVDVQGNILQAVSLVRILELFLEYSCLWVRVEQLEQEVASDRASVIVALLNSHNAIANAGGRV